MSAAPSIRMDNICRTCLFEQQNMKSVFDTDSNSGETHPLFEMLMACTAIQVEDGDGLPAQICLSCINHLARAFTFKRLCEDSDATLRKVLRKLTATDNDEPLIEREPSSDIALCAQETPADNNQDMLDIKMIHFEEGDIHIGNLTSGTGLFDCEKGEIKMINSYDLDLETNILITENQQSISAMPDATSITATAENDVNTDSQYKKLVTASSSKTYTRLKGHVCSYCAKRFTTAKYLNRHERLHAGEISFICNVCNEAFTSPANLRTHLRTVHSEERPVVCDVCGKHFSFASELSKHMPMHTGDKPYKCHVCPKSCARKGNLLRHIQKDHGENQLMCNVCKKDFPDIGNLCVHLRSHTVDRPFVCDVCDKGFHTSWNLKVHKLIHTGEKPHKCHVCSKAFIRRQTLQRHILTMHYRQ